MMKLKKQKKSGFTFIELLVSAVIVITLSTIALVYYQSAQRKSRDSKRKSDLQQIRAALEMHRSQEGVYPSGDWAAMITELTATGNEYLGQAPQDPGNASYVYSSSGATYTMCAHLESDTSGSCSISGCDTGTGTPCNYEVNQP